MYFLTTTITLLSLSKLHSTTTLLHHQLHHHRTLTKVRLKWVKNRGLDHIIDRETDLKAACLLKDAIKRSSTSFITSKSVANYQKHLGLTIPVLRFMRRYPTLFLEFPHARYPSLPCFRLTDTALFLDNQESQIYNLQEPQTVQRLSKLLMMLQNKQIPLQSLLPLKWDLGFPDNFISTLIPKYPDHFRVVKATNGLSCLSLVNWREEFAISTLQEKNENRIVEPNYRKFKSGKTVISFPMSFPRGYGSQKKVKAWMDDFHKLPYISPYEDSSSIDPNSDLMEKRVVGVLHELLSLTIHKKTKRNYLRCLREELNLPHKFTRIFTRYPGIFYLSLKCKTTTVALKEGYQKGKLVDPHPLARIRDKYHYVMRTGVLYRGKGNLDLIHEGESKNEEGGVQQQNLEDEDMDDEEYSEGEIDSDIEEEGSESDEE